MSEQTTVVQEANNAPAKKVTVKSLFESDGMKARINEILGKRAATFTTSVIQLVNQSKELAECEPMSVVNAAMVAATLELPLNNNLGFAYVVPYNVKQPDGTWAKVAQFQLGYKGFKQLALRTGQFLNINQTDVRLGEIKGRDRLEGTIEFEWIESEEQRLKTPVIGYASTFKLQNGFKSVFYMSVEELEAHAKKFSKVYAKGGGLWATDKKGMSEKTVTKLNLSKNAPLSVEDKANQNLVNALRADQAVINDFEDINAGVEFPDNDTQDAEFTYIDPAEEAAAMEAETMEKINAKNAGKK